MVGPNRHQGKRLALEIDIWFDPDATKLDSVCSGL